MWRRNKGLIALFILSFVFLLFGTMFVAGQKNVPTVYAEWGGRNCVRIETNDGRNPSCLSPEGKKILRGEYERVWVPHNSSSQKK